MGPLTRKSWSKEMPGILLLCTINATILCAQNAKMDSVLRVFETSSNDSLKIEALYELTRLHRHSDIAKALDYADQGIKLAKATGYDKLAAEAANYLGIIYHELGDLEKTLGYFYEVQAFYKRRQDSLSLSRVYNNLGLILKDLGRRDEAIDYFKRSIRLKEKLGGDTTALASTLSNVGLLYHEQFKDYEEAHRYYLRALEIDRRFNNTLGIFISLCNIADNFYAQEKYDSSKYYYELATNYIDDIESNQHKAHFLGDFAKVNAVLGQYERAIEKYNSSIEKAKLTDAKVILMESYEGLAMVYKALGDYKSALEFYEEFGAIQEVIYDSDKAKALASVEKNYQIRAKQGEIELLRKESEIKDLRLSKNRLVIYWLAGILVLVAIIVLLQYRKNLYKSRTNEILRQQNNEIIQKNRDIMDSIFYAKNIQKAILPENGKLKNIFMDAFVFMQARDVVNGDFYWFAENEDKVVIAVVDCTGHGVPAAFLNVMGNSLLNHIINEMNITSPGEILKELNKRVLSSVRSTDLASKSDAGMDVAVCLYDRHTKRLTFSGAKRPLYYFTRGELNILKGDYYPVGGRLYEEQREYKEHEVSLQANDVLYLFTDGIVDQFGGEKDKKFMYPRFRELLYTLKDNPMENQYRQIKENIENWKGRNEQTDDILVIGIRV